MDGHCVFEGTERGTNKSFTLVLEDRTAGTLLPIIKQYIYPGTRIISDNVRYSICGVHAPNCQSLSEFRESL